MKTIYKYELKAVQHQFIALPEDSKPLIAEFQDDKLCVWVLTPDTKKIKKDYSFYIIGTGWIIEKDNQLNYVSTVFNEGLVWHIFYENPELLEAE